MSTIIDGDTFKDNLNNTYRLLGVDTPESFDYSNNFEPTYGIQNYYAKQATDLSKSLIHNKYVKVEPYKLDVYQRIVSKVSFNSIDLSKYLLKNGLARIKYISPNKKDYYYYPDLDYYNGLLGIELHAKVNKVGIWGLSTINQKMVFPK
ncbi:MAG: thermonuclease family protein [Mycoplasmataceae bacterium]|nr:thermonuclease family protein [Mycoplasmataceae bacterium]